MPSPTASELKQAISNKTAIVGVVGLGYVGLPLIQAFVKAGFRTMGFDVDQSKVKRLLAGESYIGHIPSSGSPSGLKHGDSCRRPTCGDWPRPTRF